MPETISRRANTMDDYQRTLLQHECLLSQCLIFREPSRGFVWDLPLLPPRERVSPSTSIALGESHGSHLLLRWRMQIAKCVTRFMRRIPKKTAGSPALARGYKSTLVAAISFRSHGESRGERDITHGPRNSYSRQVNKSAATRARKGKARERERERERGTGRKEGRRERHGRTNGVRRHFARDAARRIAVK